MPVEEQLDAEPSVKLKNFLKWFEARDIKPEIDFTSGYCLGDSFYGALCEINGKGDEYKKITEAVSNPDFDMHALQLAHEEYMQKKRKGQEDEFLRRKHEDYLDILEYFSSISILFEPSKIISGSAQNSLLQTANFLNGAIGVEGQILEHDKLIENEFNFCGPISGERLAQFLNDVMKENKLVMIQIPGVAHAVSFLKKNGKYYYFEPGWTKFESDNTEELVNILCDLWYLGFNDRPIATSIQIYDYARNQPAEYPTPEAMMQTCIEDLKGEKLGEYIEPTQSSVFSAAAYLNDIDSLKLACRTASPNGESIPALNSLLRYQKIAPVHMAVGGNSPESISILKQYGANLDYKNDFKKIEPAIISGCSLDRFAVMSSLVENGANLNESGYSKRTALSVAIRRKNDDIINLLLNTNKIDLNQKVESKEYTVLIIAAYQGQADLVKKLLELGADPTLKDLNGKTALDWAKEVNSSPEVIEILNRALLKAYSRHEEEQIVPVITKSLTFSSEDSISATERRPKPPIEIEKAKDTKKRSGKKI